MIIQTKREISALPDKVWGVLLDFSNYSKWNPFREITGSPRLGERVILYIGPNPSRRHRVWAKIIVLEPGRRITFRTGIPLISLSTETFRLEPTSAGTQLFHIAEIKAPQSWFLKSQRFQEGLVSVYQRVDNELAKYVIQAGRGGVRQGKR